MSEEIMTTYIDLSLGSYSITYDNGARYWYLNGKLHRVGGPAVDSANGDKEWFLNGKHHREGGPAYESADGNKFWYRNGDYHREDGPAIELTCGSKAWYLNGKIASEQEVISRYPPLKTEENKEVCKCELTQLMNTGHNKDCVERR